MCYYSDEGCGQESIYGAPDVTNHKLVNYLSHRYRRLPPCVCPSSWIGLATGPQAAWPVWAVAGMWSPALRSAFPGESHDTHSTHSVVARHSQSEEGKIKMIVLIFNIHFNYKTRYHYYLYIHLSNKQI